MFYIFVIIIGCEFSINWLFLFICMSSMEEGFPLCCRSLVGREVKGIGESNSKGDFLVSSPSLILDSEKTKDMSVGGSDEVEIHAQKNKRDEKVLERANGKAKRQKGDNVGMVGEKVRKGKMVFS